MVVAEQRTPGWVEANGLALAVEDGQQIQVGLEERIELVDVVAQIFFGPTAMRDVVVGRHHAYAGQGRGGQLEPDGLAVGADHADLFLGQHATVAHGADAGVLGRGQRGTIDAQELGLVVTVDAEAEQLLRGLVGLEDLAAGVRDHDAKGQVVEEA